MLRPILILAGICGFVQSSGVAPLAPAGVAPVVTAASSQYFERTFNRLIAAPPPVLEPVIPVAPPPPVFIPPIANNGPVAVAPTQNIPAAPVQPNVAIAVATAHAAAPVATILLPPYPFGLPPSFGFVPPIQPNNVPQERPKETTTPSTTTRQTEPTTTEREPETTPVPSNSDNSFVQASPSNENVNFKQYGLPLPLPSRPHVWSQQQPLPSHPQVWSQQQPLPQLRPQPQPQPWPQPHPHLHIHTKTRPQKLRTSVEVVPVPLAYIAPPPLHTHQPHKHIKVVKHIYGFVPASSAKIIIRPASAPLRIRSVRGHNIRLASYKAPVLSRSVRLQNLGPVNRETEPTTFRPFPRPSNKPPRV